MTLDEIRTGDTRTDDWGGYGEAATTDEAIAAAQRFADWCLPLFPEWREFFIPASDGGVMLDLLLDGSGGGGILIEWEADGRSLANQFIERLENRYP